jgi:glycosyltransferase involved in cell wall biosynthesis
MIPAARLRILYEGSLASNPAGTGTFVRGLLAVLQTRPEVEVVVSRFDPSLASTLDTRRKTATARLRRGVSHLDYYWRELPRHARAAHCDAIFCPSSLVPLRGGTPYLMTVFDTTPWQYPGTQDWLSRTYIAAMLRRGAKRARAICTISQSVRNEIGAMFPGIDRDRVFVAYPGPNPDLLEAEPVPVRIPDRPFALMVGTVEPRKNHITALRALADHVQRHPRSDLMLIAAGSAGWLYEPVTRAIDELGLGKRVIRLGQVDAGSLKWLYRHARVLLFPSLYEGFGLPVLEALSLECPVLASKIPSVAEITGEDGLLAPTDVPAWAHALDRIVAVEPSMDVAAAGLRRAQQFTWERCADSVISAIVGVRDKAA